MRIATYNIENLFFRHKRLMAVNRFKTEEHIAEMNKLMNKAHKSISDYDRMRELWSFLNPEHTIAATNMTERELTWLELINQSHLPNKILARKVILSSLISHPSVLLGPETVQNKAMVIKDASPDVLLLQEVESQKGLDTFLSLFFDKVYPTRIFVPTLDRFGRGMAILCKEGFSVSEITSFTDVFPSSKETNHAAQLYKLVTHDSKWYDIANLQFFLTGSEEGSSPVCEELINQIVKWLKLEMYGTAYRMIVGSLDILPHSKLLQPIIDGLKMKYSNRLSSFYTELDFGKGRHYHGLGTYAKGVNLTQKDYFLIDDLTASKTVYTGMNRKGLVPIEKEQWRTYDRLNNTNAASRHPLLTLDMA